MSPADAKVAYLPARCTTEEARAQRDALEAEVLEAVRRFENQTGCTVTALRVNRSDRNKVNVLWYVDAQVQL